MHLGYLPVMSECLAVSVFACSMSADQRVEIIESVLLTDK